jgi:hypothetical protein
MRKPKQIDRYQIRFDQEVFVDLFSGGGGASMGIEAATAMPVFAAVNHNPDAIAMHMTNHPYTKHYQTSVWDVDPLTACEGRPVGLLWASPDCTHFSKARCGNAVCPPMAEAMVRANFPEYCTVDVSTLAQLMNLISV